MGCELAASPIQGPTQVIESRLHKRINRRVFAGIPRSTGPWQVGDDGVARRLLAFAPGDRFGFDLWASNDYGSTRWRVVVCEALGAARIGDKVPDVRPFVSILADVAGAKRVQAFLAWLGAKDDDLQKLSEGEWGRASLYFNRAPLVRLKGMAAGLEVGSYAES